jgi:hypothetical protein
MRCVHRGYVNIFGGFYMFRVGIGKASGCAGDGLERRFFGEKNSMFVQKPSYRSPWLSVFACSASDLASQSGSLGGTKR